MGGLGGCGAAQAPAPPPLSPAVPMCCWALSPNCWRWRLVLSCWKGEVSFGDGVKVSLHEEAAVGAHHSTVTEVRPQRRSLMVHEIVKI